MSHGYSVAQTARLVCTLRWTCTRLSEMLEAWAADASGHAEAAFTVDASSHAEAAFTVDASDHVATALAADASGHAEVAARLWELSRRLAAHREALDSLQPTSEAMASWRQPAVAEASLATAIDELAASTGSRERFEITTRVLVPQLLRAYAAICEHGAPHCDAALISVAGALGFDLDREHLTDVAAAEATPTLRAATEAEQVLAAVGGLVAPSVLQPRDWP